MWRTTMIAAGMAVALGGAAADLSAQGRAQGRATEGYERRDERDRRGSVARGTTGRATGRATTTRENRPEVLQGDRRGTSGPVYGRGVDRRDRDWDRDRDRDRDSDRYDRRRDDRRYDRYEVNRKNAPAFCRSGRGHPVHGREWCRQKGYGLGDDRWERARWDDVIFGRRNTTGRVSGSILEQIVGRTIYNRLALQSRQLGGGSMYGQWMTPSGGPRMLHVYSGNRALAEFVDANRDGRAELVLLNLGR